RATRVDLLPMLKSPLAAAGRSRQLAGRALIAVQVVVALVLVAGSAMFLRTLLNLRKEPLGFRPENLLVFQLNPTLNGYKNEALLDFHQNALQQVASVPGVRSASMSR